MKFITISMFLFILVSCTGNSSGNIDTYEEKVMSVEEYEKANPVQFLTASGTYRRKIFNDRAKINGYIESSATVARYKDITVEVTFYTATDTELGRERYVLYKFVDPGKKVAFFWTIDVPPACQKLGWDVLSAMPAN
jgi:hypothetical protein